MNVNSLYEEKIEYVESIKMSNPQKAFDNASNLYVQIKDELNVSQQLCLMYFIGSMKWKLVEYESALMDAVEIIDLSVDQNEITYELKAYNLLGLVYSDLDNLDVALEYFKLSLNL